MRRGEVWWAHLPDGTKRPVLTLSRDDAYLVRRMVTVAPITTRVRGIRVEVELDVADGLPQHCAVNLDRVTTLPREVLRDRLTKLPTDKLERVAHALRFALALDP
ncbi:MAG: type II toxin-antitoxin system PemK/MazF family toxin [Holophagales bacterium]|nr:type II toxin-antitoxin system PemK/MazF family toxin [Holophagales bacterium]